MLGTTGDHTPVHRAPHTSQNVPRQPRRVRLPAASTAEEGSRLLKLLRFPKLLGGPFGAAVLTVLGYVLLEYNEDPPPVDGGGSNADLDGDSDGLACTDDGACTAVVAGQVVTGRENEVQTHRAAGRAAGTATLQGSPTGDGPDEEDPRIAQLRAVSATPSITSHKRAEILAQLALALGVETTAVFGKASLSTPPTQSTGEALAGNGTEAGRAKSDQDILEQILAAHGVDITDLFSSEQLAPIKAYAERVKQDQIVTKKPVLVIGSGTADADRILAASMFVMLLRKLGVDAQTIVFPGGMAAHHLAVSRETQHITAEEYKVRWNNPDYVVVVDGSETKPWMIGNTALDLINNAKEVIGLDHHTESSFSDRTTTDTQTVSMIHTPDAQSATSAILAMALRAESEGLVSFTQDEVRHLFWCYLVSTIGDTQRLGTANAQTYAQMAQIWRRFGADDPELGVEAVMRLQSTKLPDDVAHAIANAVTARAEKLAIPVDPTGAGPLVEVHMADISGVNWQPPGGLDQSPPESPRVEEPDTGLHPRRAYPGIPLAVVAAGGISRSQVLAAIGTTALDALDARSVARESESENDPQSHRPTGFVMLAQVASDRPESALHFYLRLVDFAQVEVDQLLARLADAGVLAKDSAGKFLGGGRLWSQRTWGGRFDAEKDVAPEVLLERFRSLRETGDSH